MIALKKDMLFRLCVLYLAIPISLFFLIWCKWYIALFSTLSIVYIYIKYIRKEEFETVVHLPYKYFFLIIGIIILWCILGGQGNLYYQSGDWWARNDIYKNMIMKDIPITFGNDTFLCYYFGHWIVPMTLSKILLLIGISSSIVWKVGNIFLLIWTSLGIILSFLFMISILKLNRTWKIIVALVIFIFFSGLDVVGLLIRNGNFSDHIEMWNVYFQFSSQTTQLFWVFNQAIPAWIGILVLISLDNIRNDIFIGALLILFSPLPLIGCFLICIFKIIFKYLKKLNIKKFFQDLFTKQNILSLIFIFPALITFVFSNAKSGGNNGLLFNINIGEINFYNLFMLIIFIFVEYGIYVTFIFKRHKRNYILWSILICLPFIAAFRFGTTNDFEMRASIPFLFCLMMFIIKQVTDEIEIKNRKIIFSTKSILLSLCLIIGSVTPFIEFYRGYHEVRTKHKINLVAENISIEDYGDNFIATTYNDKLFGILFGK